MAFEFLPEEKAPEKSVREKSVGLGKEVARHPARVAFNLGTLASGLPGDILSTANEFVAKPIYELATGKEGSEYEDTLLGKLLPGSRTQRENIKSQFPEFGKFIEPQNKVEKFVDDVIEDASLLFSGQGARSALPAIKKASQLKKGARALAISSGANIAGETAKNLTGDEKKASWTKAGLLFLGSVLNPGLASRQAGELYNSARKNLPENASINSSKLNSNLNKIEKTITKGRPVSSLAPNEKFVLDRINEVKALEEAGQYGIEQLWAQKKSLNDRLSNLYEEFGSSKIRNSVKNNSKMVTKSINETLEEYGKLNPEFYRDLSKADEIYGTIAKSNSVSDWVKRNKKSVASISGLSSIFGPGLSSTAGNVAGAMGLHESARILYQISRSPELVRLYSKALSAAVKEDSVLFNKYYEELDKKLYKNQSWEIVD